MKFRLKFDVNKKKILSTRENNLRVIVIVGAHTTDHIFFCILWVSKGVWYSDKSQNTVTITVEYYSIILFELVILWVRAKLLETID